MKLFIVDVFAEQKYAGNQLAIVIDTERISADTMRAIAAEMNFSETTFVTPSPEADGGFRVRLFTPTHEVAFGGHPILGTAWVVREKLLAGAPSEIRLNLQIGQVPVSFDDAEGESRVWFRAPAMQLGRGCDRGLMAAALGITEAEIDGPVQQVSAGTSAMIVPLRSLAALQAARLSLDGYRPLLAAEFPPLVYLWCRQTRDPRNDLTARFFFESRGVREDPATGNGAAFLGEYLLRHRPLGPPPLSLRIEQGHEVHRPSIVMLSAEIAGDHSVVRVGGGVVPVLEGRLT
jgi:trans-2,3-dihydro-3-hydroxyanthranilate isomerase